jgi:hypothetical protein
MASRRLNLSGVQVSAGLLATLTGAVAASYLGVGGTLIGAAIGSLASTVGGEVYRHYLGRTHERLRGAVNVHRYRTARSAVGRQVDPTVALNRLGVTSRRPDDEDAVETQVFQVPRPGDAAHGAAAAPNSTSPSDSIHDAPTEIFAAADGRSQTGPAATPTAASVAAGSTAEVGAAEGGAAEGGAAGGGAAEGGAANGSDGTKNTKKRQRWLVLAAVAAGTFLIAVAVITVFELSVGKTLSATVRGQSGSGTTVTGVLGGRTAKPTPPAAKQTASATPSTTGSPSSTASVVPTSSAAVGTTPSPTIAVTPGDPASTPTPSS